MKTFFPFDYLNSLRILKRNAWMIILMALILLGLSVSSGDAFEPVANTAGQPDVGLPISTLPEDQLFPKAAYASGMDEYLVVWEDVARSDDYDIYAIRVDNTGYPIGSEIQIDIDAYMDTHPSVAYSPVMNEYLVVWENEYETNPDDHDILGQRIDAYSGSMVGGYIQVSYSGQYDMKPVVTYDQSMQEYLVVYERRMGSDEFYQQDVYARRISQDGTPIGDYLGIAIATSAVDEQDPSVASDGLNYLVAWQGDYGEETNIYGQLVGYDGSLIGGQIGISTWQNDQLVPQITYDNDDGQYFVVWEDHYFYPYEIYGQRLNTSGYLVGNPIGIALGGSNNRTAPDVAYMPASRSYLVVWQYEYSTVDHDIYGRRVAYDGSHPDNEYIITGGGAEEQRPAVAANNGSQGLVVWDDARNYNLDIFGSVETLNVPTLSGVVYEGDVGNPVGPIPGVVVELGCSNSYGYFGDLIGVAVTDYQGGYQLPAVILCEYYNIIETDPAGYFSTGAQSSGGNVYNSNWIYYTYPLTGKVWNGNLFWDKPSGPGDVTPPGNWTNFSPTGWVNTQTVPASEQVEDTQTGLDVSTAAYQYSTNGGASWSGWIPASITGNDGDITPQVISANVPFGQDSESQNLVQFQVADMVGNLGIGPTHLVMVDSVVPLNPTSVSSTTHSPNVWSNNQYISIQWTGAYDERSGIYGYSTSFDQNPYTIPDIYRDTADPYLTNYAYIDSNSWWFHVRTLDNAGNAAVGALHYGPFLIDTNPPTAWMTTTGGYVNQLTISIGWAGGDTLSGIYSYDVQNNINGGGWNDWLVNTQYTSSTYTGARGQEVYFRVRAHDYAGNISDWSSTISIYFGVSVLVRVENENGIALNGAEVYMNGVLQGETYGNGTWTLYNVLLGDQLAGRYKVAEQNSSKGAHNCCGGDYSYRTYITSINFDNAGNPQLQIINDTNVTQVVRVRRDNTLISFYLLVSVEWDADSTYLSELRTGLESASQYLFDLSDGQMMFGIIQVYDNSERWYQADIRIHASNQVWPNAHGSIGGIWHDIDEHIYMGRYFNGQWSNSGSWTGASGFRTFIHEFGHYGMSLYDEYLNRSGGKDGQGCTIDRNTTPVDVQASFMDFQYTATEMCSSLPIHPHNTNTLQDDENGGPCWNTVYDRYKDLQNPPRWIIERPSDRGSIMPGPNAIPIPGWSYILWDDNNTGACEPFETSWVYEGSGLPAIDFDIMVLSNSLYQGKTVANAGNSAGVITILGAYNGSTIYASKSCGWFCTDSGKITANCSLQSEAQGPSTYVPSSPLVLQRDPFAIEISSQPIGDGTSLMIFLQGSTSFPSTPQVQVLQDGSLTAIPVTLSFDGVKYSGTANLDPSMDLSGNIIAQATNADNYTVYRIAPFNVELVNETGLTWLASSDGNMEIYLQAGSLPSNTAVSIQTKYQVNMDQGQYTLMGNPYQVMTSTGENSLSIPAAINIYYSTGFEHFLPAGLYRWDENNQIWVLISTTIDIENQFVSAEINQLGTYAVLGVPMYLINIPIINK